jgi:hypothetical protein
LPHSSLISLDIAISPFLYPALISICIDFGMAIDAIALVKSYSKLFYLPLNIKTYTPKIKLK